MVLRIDPLSVHEAGDVLEGRLGVERGPLPAADVQAWRCRQALRSVLGDPGVDRPDELRRAALIGQLLEFPHDPVGVEEELLLGRPGASLSEQELIRALVIEVHTVLADGG